MEDFSHLDHVGGRHVVPLGGRLLGRGVLLAGDLADVDHLLFWGVSNNGL